MMSLRYNRTNVNDYIIKGCCLWCKQWKSVYSSNSYSSYYYDTKGYCEWCKNYKSVDGRIWSCCHCHFKSHCSYRCCHYNHKYYNYPDYLIDKDKTEVKYNHKYTREILNKDTTTRYSYINQKYIYYPPINSSNRHRYYPINVFNDPRSKYVQSMWDDNHSIETTDLYNSNNKSDQRNLSLPITNSFIKSNNYLINNSNDVPSEYVPSMIDDIHTAEIMSLNNDNYKGDQRNTEVIFDKPVGFNNPQGYCFLNSIIQVLRGCTDLTKEIMKICINEEIKYKDEENVLLLRDLGQLFTALTNKDLTLIEYSVDKVQKYFKEDSEGDDVHKFYLQLLSKLNKGLQMVDATQPKSDVDEPSDKANEIFKKKKMENKGFIFDLFYGQMNIKIKCSNCSNILQDGYSLFKSIPLPLPKEDKKLSLKKFIKSFLMQSKIEEYDGKKCDCSHNLDKYVTEIEISHAPTYLMLYLNRGSYFQDGEKNNVTVSTKDILKLSTIYGDVKYKLISVIDHVGDNMGGHYYCKCNYESNLWWLINDTQVTEAENIVTNKTIVFLFKKK